jgi:exodeoxyribonuclease VII small subunit
MTEDNKPDDETEGSLESIVTRLEEIVRLLEGDSVPLETSLREFETGMALTRKAQNLLSAAEQRIEVLSQTDMPAAADDDEVE